jgi:hypothetical protein
MPLTISSYKVSSRLYDALQELDLALRAESDCDFAYSVAVRGHLVCASNKQSGIVVPSRSTQRCPSCLDVPGKDGLGRVCKRCKGSGEVSA